jgi:hypothetical protein
MRVRPLPGLHFDVLADGTVEVCKEPPFSTACGISARWLQDVLIVNDDLFIGGQFSRRQLRRDDTAAVSTDGTVP